MVSGDNSDETQEEEASPDVIQAEIQAKAKQAAKRKIYAPELALVDPKPRTFSNTSIVNKPPCGTTEKGLVHYMATPGSRNYI